MLQRLLVLFGIIGLILSACGGDDDEDSNTNDTTAGTPIRLEITLSPIPEQQLVEGCPPQELEDWLEATYFNMQGFLEETRAEVRDTNSSRRGDFALFLQRMIALRDQVASVPTPFCVVQEADTIVALMQDIVVGTQAFVNGDKPSSDYQEETTASLDQIENQYNGLLERVNSLYESTQ